MIKRAVQGSFRRRFWLLIFTALLSGCLQSEKTQFLTQGEQELEAGKYDEAKSTYMKVLQLDPFNAVAAAKLGRIWLEEGAPWRAGLFLKKAVELEPHDGESRLRLAQVYLALGADNKAREEVLKVLQESPPNEEALLRLTEMAHTPEEIAQAKEILRNFPHKETASYQLADANLTLRRKDFVAAEAAVRKAIALAPVSAEAHQALGFLELLQNRPGEAVQAFRIAITLAPVRSPVQINYAQLLKKTAGPEAATDYLKTITARAPDFFSAWIALAQVALQAKKYDEAMADLAKVFSRDPQNVESRLLQSDIWLAQTQPDKVILALKQLEKSYPDLPGVNSRLGKAYLMENNLPQARAALDRALAKDPHLADDVLARAELSLANRDPEEAVKSLQELLKRRPTFQPAQELLDKARRVLEQNQTTSPPRPESPSPASSPIGR